MPLPNRTRAWIAILAVWQLIKISQAIWKLAQPKKTRLLQRRWEGNHPSALTNNPANRLHWPMDDEQDDNKEDFTAKLNEVWSSSATPSEAPLTQPSFKAKLQQPIITKKSAEAEKAVKAKDKRPSNALPYDANTALEPIKIASSQQAPDIHHHIQPLAEDLPTTPHDSSPAAAMLDGVQLEFLEGLCKANTYQMLMKKSTKVSNSNSF